MTLSITEQKELLETVSEISGIQDFILEKDIWICWVLKTIFSIKNSHPMAFKGGTSLSKVYGIIDRFSEDIDITLDYRYFEDDFDPFDNNASKSAIRRFGDRIKSNVEVYTKEYILPALKEASLELPGMSDPNISLDGECLNFNYKSVIRTSNDYFEATILLEFGGRNVITPSEQYNITPDIAKFTKDINYPIATVTVLSPQRTFWEKATLIHVECNRRRLSSHPDRLARHWFDLTCLFKSNIGLEALNNRVLLEDVVRHKTIFFNAGYTHYDQCLDGRFRLVPDQDQLEGLRSDYNKMFQAGLLGINAPKFENLMQEIEGIESYINDYVNS